MHKIRDYALLLIKSLAVTTPERYISSEFVDQIDIPENRKWGGACRAVVAADFTVFYTRCACRRRRRAVKRRLPSDRLRRKRLRFLPRFMPFANVTRFHPQGVSLKWRKSLLFHRKKRAAKR